MLYVGVVRGFLKSVIRTGSFIHADTGWVDLNRDVAPSHRYLPGDSNKRQPEMDWMGRMGSITLHGQFSLSGSRSLPSPGIVVVHFTNPASPTGLSVI